VQLVPVPNNFEAETAITELNKYKSPGNGQIPSERIEEGGEMLRTYIPKQIHFISSKEEFAYQ
jgi:hypothetical protein